MSGLATCELLRRQREVFDDARFERLAGISSSHVYNLRASKTYVAKRTVWTKTRASTVSIALRAAPDPQGMPGHLRVDTVHQGDRDGVKGLYLINVVDEVTQYEYRGGRVRHLGKVPGAAARSPAVAVPIRRGRVPCGQRIRVHQPPRGQAAEQAAHPEVHQVAGAALE